jgi:hypothetical protein
MSLSSSGLRVSSSFPSPLLRFRSELTGYLYIPCCAVTGKKITFYSLEPAQFQAQAGEEMTQMLQWSVSSFLSSLI